MVNCALACPALFSFTFYSYGSFLELKLISLGISVSAAMLKCIPFQIIQFVIETSRFSSGGTFQFVGLKADLPSLMVLNMPIGLVLSMFSS